MHKVIGFLPAGDESVRNCKRQNYLANREVHEYETAPVILIFSLPSQYQVDARRVYIGSDQVFDGDEPSPFVYRSPAAQETVAPPARSHSKTYYKIHPLRQSCHYSVTRTIKNPMTQPMDQVRGGTFCRPADWTDVAKFFLANFITHAFTVITAPGARRRESMLFTIWTLFIPFIGATRAAVVIARYARGEKDDLKVAHKAGALYTLLRVTRDGRERFNVEPNGEHYGDSGPWLRLNLDHYHINVHGTYPAFPSAPGNWETLYYPVRVPFDYIVEPLPARHYEDDNELRQIIPPLNSGYAHEITTVMPDADPSLEAAQLLDCTLIFKPLVANAA
ncbi:hypothetical protein K440DRAFT_660741 [Wilcoxina mikolae CBS 423.85]|nr:hypothetical protein K440DRAFT_660741 [Wilcoxina mikolae CBS 423.85]